MGAAEGWEDGEGGKFVYRTGYFGFSMMSLYMFKA